MQDANTTSPYTNLPMSLFIHRENQTLLWETLHKSPFWSAFEMNMGENTQLWFRNIMSQFYDRRWETRPDLQMTVDDLKQMNKEVILYCVQDIKRCLGITISPTYPKQNEYNDTPPVVAPMGDGFDMSSRLAMYDRPPTNGILSTPPTVLPHGNNTNNTNTTNINNTNNTNTIPTYAQLQAEFTSPGIQNGTTVWNASEQKEIITKRAAAEFEAFQRQYSDQYHAPKPDAIDFHISLNEPKIKNMEELMEQQMKYREMEDKVYTPALSVGANQPMSATQ